MDREKWLEIDLHMDELISHLGDNQELAVRFVKKFPLDRSFSAFVDAYRKKDYDIACRYAHQLKGLTANLCMESLCVLMTGFLSAVKDGDYGRADHLEEEAEKLYGRICAVIEENL